MVKYTKMFPLLRKRLPGLLEHVCISRLLKRRHQAFLPLFLAILNAQLASFFFLSTPAVAPNDSYVCRLFWGGLYEDLDAWTHAFSSTVFQKLDRQIVLEIFFLRNGLGTSLCKVIKILRSDRKASIDTRQRKNI